MKILNMMHKKILKITSIRVWNKSNTISNIIHHSGENKYIFFTVVNIIFFDVLNYFPPWRINFNYCEWCEKIQHNFEKIFTTVVKINNFLTVVNAVFFLMCWIFIIVEWKLLQYGVKKSNTISKNIHHCGMNEYLLLR